MQLRGQRRNNATDRFVEWSDLFVNPDDAAEEASFEQFMTEEWPEKDSGFTEGTDQTNPTYLYVVEDIKVEFNRLYQQGSTSEPESTSLKFGYFFEGASQLGKSNELNDMMFTEFMRSRYLIYFVTITAIFFVIGLFLIKDTSEKVTRGIIQLYETLEEILIQKEKSGKTTAVLKYKKSSLEVNQLHLRFNEVARTAILASSGMGDEKEKALLNYAEAYYIFVEFNDDKHRGICLANIGAIMMQKKDYDMAYVSFNLSCKIISESINFESEDSRVQTERGSDMSVNKFILACRQFQKGLANFAILKENYTNRDVLNNDFDTGIGDRFSSAFGDQSENDKLIGKDKDVDFADFDKMLTDRKKDNEAGNGRSLSIGRNIQWWGWKIEQIEKDFAEAIGNLGQAGLSGAGSND